MDIIRTARHAIEECDKATSELARTFGTHREIPVPLRASQIVDWRDRPWCRLETDVAQWFVIGKDRAAMDRAVARIDNDTDYDLDVDADEIAWTVPGADSLYESGGVTLFVPYFDPHYGEPTWVFVANHNRVAVIKTR